ncbi:LacI family DNA-binding transcriptional regulator [Marihabitans asiaticum]|uniref:LacI family transcriptional regulator n=1 Tax=Marihabitans asiaticum TaxID=415218 RepID=A0A560WFQ2_9MICO|nr:LacI family DNA-binding transcriptional regulator [Marihabitans asiaticum]TWD16509.1 LacI family transcriptional regulator [Marihabitans asiaticum]
MRSHRVRDIAEQAGLSAATVDRVLHGRPGASPRAARAVEQAVAELDRQERALRLGARPIVVDVVMQAPRRFTDRVREAVESQLPGIPGARARFDLREGGEPADLVRVLERVGRPGRSSHGVLLKAPAVPEVESAVARLADRGVPVVTLVTDLRAPRIAYVGLDNAAAGQTAAYLVARMTRSEGSVLTTVSRSSFYGEEERRSALVAELDRLRPDLEVLGVADADGLDGSTGDAVRAALAGLAAPVVAVYSAGGGNRAVLGALDEAGQTCETFVAHDLDADNLALLRAGRIDVVLHHDLRADARTALTQLLRHHHLEAGSPVSVGAAVQVVTRTNIPARLGPAWLR